MAIGCPVSKQAKMRMMTLALGKIAMRNSIEDLIIIQQ